MLVVPFGGDYNRHVSKLLISDFVRVLQHKASGRILYEDVVTKLQLLEADYFDLEYINGEGIAVSIYIYSFRTPPIGGFTF